MQPEKKIELLISTLNSEMSRFWTRFNIFGAVQVAAAVALIANAEFLKLNVAISRALLTLLLTFSVVGAIAIFRGYDLQRSIVLTLSEIEQDQPEADRLLAMTHRNMRCPLYFSNITCIVFGFLCSLFWLVGWIALEVIGFQISIPK